jgi:GH25 family lysozyme M1 (1,4-beta-N-acetylmuramidase)
VSGRWDGLVDFNVTAAYGAKFAFVKAVDGTVPTAYWKENNQSAYDAGLLNSSYAWLYPDNRINCTLQAKAYYDLIKDAKLRLPPAIDFEWTKYAGIQANPNYTDLRKWLAAFIRLSGVKPILYTAAGYVSLFGAVPADILDMLAGEWVASYGGTVPSMPKGIAKWDVWQFSANGDALKLCPGNQGKRELDLNYMQKEFYEKYSGATLPEEPEGETMQGKVLVNLNIRPTPGSSLPAIGQLAPGDIVEASANLAGWWRLTKLVRNAVVLPLPAVDCYAYEGVTKGYIQTIAAPPPPPSEEYILHVKDGVTRKFVISNE